jgi:predicted RNase H-like nuclease (RuvC/YqgF family)
MRELMEQLDAKESEINALSSQAKTKDSKIAEQKRYIFALEDELSQFKDIISNVYGQEKK